MDDAEPFESPKLLVETVKADLPAFEASCTAFLSDCGYKVLEHIDPKSRDKIIRLRFDKRVPGRLRVQASRFVNDLRHTLDQAFCEAASALGATNTKRLYFPFSRNVADLDAAVRGLAKDVDPDLLRLVREFNVHGGDGGDADLYTLCALAGTNKHDAVLRISLSSNGGQIFDDNGPPDQEMRGPLIISFDIWNELRNEMTFARIGPGGMIRTIYKPKLIVVLGTGAPPFETAAGDVFNRIATRVEQVVLAIETETVRLLKGRAA